ncbi:SPOR domain-containing protein [Andreprevotia chitinilytica]|uniref:SPOR domain-containing protein n=1 Tax=Andreprevotia chitinilytica TaxID=396808 RepID=UPI0006909851|nr:SPOR domain-containing protein [Andreprevotia chitinilytica]
MKWLFALLLVANLLFFAYSRWVPQIAPVGERPPEVNASQVRIAHLNGGDSSAPAASSASSATAASPTASPTTAPTPAATAVPTPAATPVATPVATPAVTPAPTPAPKPTPSPKPTPPITPAPKPAPATPAPVAEAQGALCLRWTGITGDQANIARDKLRQLGLTAQETPASQNAKYWVYVPPLADLETAKKKAQQFAELGVDDYFVVNNGSKWQNAISLGIFSTQEAGNRRLEELKQKGVKSAIVRERDDGVRHTSFLIKKATDEQTSKLTKVSELLRGSYVEKVDCK